MAAAFVCTIFALPVSNALFGKLFGIICIRKEKGKERPNRKEKKMKEES